MKNQKTSIAISIVAFAAALVLGLASNALSQSATRAHPVVNADGNLYSVDLPSWPHKPVISSCGTGSGVIGGSSGFRISVGTSTSACTATFETALLDTVACIVTRQGGTGQWWPWISASSASAITIGGYNSTGSGADISSSVLHVQCLGVSLNPASP